MTYDMNSEVPQLCFLLRLCCSCTQGHAFHHRNILLERLQYISRVESKVMQGRSYHRYSLAHSCDNRWWIESFLKPFWRRRVVVLESEINDLIDSRTGIFCFLDGMMGKTIF